MGELREILKRSKPVTKTVTLSAKGEERKLPKEIEEFLKKIEQAAKRLEEKLKGRPYLRA